MSNKDITQALADFELEVISEHSQSYEIEELNLGFAQSSQVSDTGFNQQLDLPKTLQDWGVVYKSSPQGLVITVMHTNGIYDVPLLSDGSSQNWSVVNAKELKGNLAFGEAISVLSDHGQGILLSRFEQSLHIDPLIASTVPAHGIISRTLTIGRELARIKVEQIRSGDYEIHPQLDALFDEVDAWGGYIHVIEQAALRELAFCHRLLAPIDSPELIDEEVAFYELDPPEQNQRLNRLWNGREKIENLYQTLVLIGGELDLEIALQDLDHRAETAMKIRSHLMNLPSLSVDKSLVQLWQECKPSAWWVNLAVLSL